MNMRKKAQLQIMENAFILLTIFIIMIIAFVFVVGMQRLSQVEKNRELKELEILKKAQMLNFLPELQCSDNNDMDADCYDLLKIETFMTKLAEYKYYYEDYLGYSKIELRRFDPSPDIPDSERWDEPYVIYDRPRSSDSGLRKVFFTVLIKDVVNNKNYFGVMTLGVYE